MVNRILHPSEAELAEHKSRQLRELAIINGTLRGDPAAAEGTAAGDLASALSGTTRIAPSTLTRFHRCL